MLREISHEVRVAVNSTARVVHGAQAHCEILLAAAGACAVNFMVSLPEGTSTGRAAMGDQTIVVAPAQVRAVPVSVAFVYAANLQFVGRRTRYRFALGMHHCNVRWSFVLLEL